MLAGPYCGLLLADLGADVVKIEPPDGDIARRVSPHFVGPHNAYFASLNRNKKSVVLDLASDDGRDGLARLARESHALITNLRPSAIKKLGLTYDGLKSINAKLVCVALTGYGLDGPNAERPAYDYVIQALSGIMAITGEPDAPPTKTGYSAVDNSAGMLAAVGLLAKIVEGRGGQVDVAMYDTMLSQLNYLAGGAAERRREAAAASALVASVHRPRADLPDRARLADAVHHARPVLDEVLQRDRPAGVDRRSGVRDDEGAAREPRDGRPCDQRRARDRDRPRVDASPVAARRRRRRGAGTRRRARRRGDDRPRPRRAARRRHAAVCARSAIRSAATASRRATACRRCSANTTTRCSAPAIARG